MKHSVHPAFDTDGHNEEQPPTGIHSGDRSNQPAHDYYFPTSPASPVPHPITHEDRYNDAHPLSDPRSLLIPSRNAELCNEYIVNQSEENSTLKHPVVEFEQYVDHLPDFIIDFAPPSPSSVYQFEPQTYPVDVDNVPEIVIDFAPPSRPSGYEFEPPRYEFEPPRYEFEPPRYEFEPPRYPADVDALSPPDRSRSRNRTRQKTDPFSTITSTSRREQDVEQKDRERAHSEPAQQQRQQRSNVSGTYTPDPIAATNLNIPEDRPAGKLDAKRTQMRPATFQCTLCPKRFMRAYNLRSHLRTHTDERPFVCSICGKAFARQKDRKRHEELHSGEKEYICKGRLKDNSSWGCGRRFARADALGRHFQSEAGCICIKPLRVEEQNVLRSQGDLRQAPGPSSKAAENVLGLPAALKFQYPALAGLDWTSQPDVSYSGYGELDEHAVKTDAMDIDDIDDIEYPQYPPMGSNDLMQLGGLYTRGVFGGETLSAPTAIGGKQQSRTHLPDPSTCLSSAEPQPLKTEYHQLSLLNMGSDPLRYPEQPHFTNPWTSAPPTSQQIYPTVPTGPQTFTMENTSSGNFGQDLEEITPAAVQSDSGYRSGLGTDTESVCSLDSIGSSFGLPQNFLHEFIAFFGDTLIERAGTRQWAQYALAHRSSEEVEKQLSALLKEFVLELSSKAPSTWASEESDVQQRIQDPAHSQVLVGATSLIRRYRPKIARYFCDNAVSIPVSETSLSTRLHGLGQQLSLNERLNLFTKSGSSTNGLLDPSVDLLAEDEIKDNDEEEALFTDLRPVRDLLVSSDAFRRLAEKLRRRLYHDDGLEMDRIRKIVLCDADKTRHEATLTVDWNLAKFMETQYGRDFPSIGCVIVLIGSSLYAQATTCADYLHATWPRSGPFLIELLDTALKNELSSTACHKTDGVSHTTTLAIGDNVFIHVTFIANGVMSFVAQGVDETLTLEMTQQIAWMGSAFSSSPFGEDLSYARPSVQRTSSDQAFDITFQYTPIHATEAACWLPLFSGAVIASGFPIPHRADEMGLEISLELLAGIAGVCHAVDYEGGVVMKSFSHMFVPVRRNDDRVQWHAISSKDSETRLTYHEALTRCEARALISEVSFNDLKSCRAIIGWCSTATSRLGSTSVNYENIDYSGAKDANSMIKCAGGSLGFQQFGTAALDFKFGLKDGKCHFQRNGPYQRIVSAAEKTPVVLYDTGEQRAWMVPASDVMLHMIQHRHWLEPFERSGKRIELDTNVLSDSSARKVLLKNQSLPLSDDDGYTFRDAILNWWSLLERLIDENVTRDRNSSGASMRATFRESLYGYEFKAVVEERSPFRRKQTLLQKTNGGWPQLICDIDALVLFADGFEDLILPTDQGTPVLCRRWQQVPKGQDYLCTSTQMLKELYDVAGCRLSHNYLTSSQLRWDQGNSTLFEPCTGTKDCECNRLQLIIPKSAVGTIVRPRHIVDTGAVIFGRSGSMVKDVMTKSPAQTPPRIYSQANVPLTPIIIGLESDDSVLSDGDGSNQTGSVDSTPGSLSSCTTLSTLDTLVEEHDQSRDSDSLACTRKRPRVQQAYPEISPHDKRKDETCLGAAHKRAKCIQRFDSSSLASLQRDVDSEIDRLSDETSTCIGDHENRMQDGSRLNFAPLAVRIADEGTVRILRRQEGFHFR